MTFLKETCLLNPLLTIHLIPENLLIFAQPLFNPCSTLVNPCLTLVQPLGKFLFQAGNVFKGWEQRGRGGDVRESDAADRTDFQDHEDPQVLF